MMALLVGVSSGVEVILAKWREGMPVTPLHNGSW
jgi:hypothetical protein